MSAYRFMWLMIMFDMPTERKKDRKKYRWFREKLIKDGYIMMQYSIYIKPFHSQEAAKHGKERIKSFIANNILKGSIRLMMFTDKQFSNMDVIVGVKKRVKKELQNSLHCFKTLKIVS